jgi:hypothetical protein
VILTGYNTEEGFNILIELIHKWGEKNWWKVDPVNDFLERGPYLGIESYMEAMKKSYSESFEQLHGSTYEEQFFGNYRKLLDDHISKYYGKKAVILHRPGDFNGMLVPEYKDKNIKPGDVSPMWGDEIPKNSETYKAFEEFKEIIKSAQLKQLEMIDSGKMPFYCSVFIFENEIDMVQLGKAKLMMA